MASALAIAIAVDSYMNGVTDTVAEITYLSGTFLPPQMSFATSNGLDPTVYGSEAVGLALSNYKNFPSTWGTQGASVFQFNLRTLTGIDGGAIAGWYLNWYNFYTANPPGFTTIDLAAKGATFGDAVGAMLNAPTANATTIARNAEVTKAVNDWNAGTYVVGVPIASEP